MLGVLGQIVEIGCQCYHREHLPQWPQIDRCQKEGHCLVVDLIQHRCLGELDLGEWITADQT